MSSRASSHAADVNNDQQAELLAGLPLFWQQLAALTRKNATLTWRHRRSAFLKLFSSFFFIFLIFCIDKAVSSRLSTTTAFRNVHDPPALVSPPIPPCEDKFFAKLPCYDFVWSGNSSARIASIVSAIMKNNRGRPIPPEKVKSFRDSQEVDAWLMSDPLRCPGALHFRERNATVISYGIQTNSTPVSRRGNFEDPNFKFQIPLQIAAEREIARSLIGDPHFKWEVGLQEFAHPATITLSAVSSIGATFFLAISMFGFVFQIGLLVAEKELKLRQAMSIMGLYESAYWLSWLIWESFLTLISALFILLFGMVFRFNFFLNNSISILFLVLFLFQINMLGFAFLISTFLSKSSSASTVGFFVFIIGLVTQMATTLVGFPYRDNFARYYRIIWSFFPPNPLAIAVKILSDATATSEDQGLNWSQRDECTWKEPDCVFTVEDSFKWLISTFFLWSILALYFDNILPDSNGVRKPLYYFLIPSYWTGKGGNNVEEGKICSCVASIPTLEESTPDDVDVIEEETTVKQQATQQELDSNIAVQMRGLVKTYPGTMNIGCCKCKKTSPYHAVRGVWLNFQRNQLFCLLGPNGAGKTTVINCLTGITPITSGDALIYGYSIRSTIGMMTIRRMIGVCPQFDILWDALSGEEHLKLFANIKGLPPSQIDMVTQKSLTDVRLQEAARMRAGSYSGGMKRRLSVAISLIGEPRLVFLDEPTTGMDPITRRHVWDIIEEAKRGRAIILTTHSMEEADILSDRIAIMAKGKLRCIGNSIHLKSRFGTGYITNISFLGNGQTTDADGEEVGPNPRIEAVKEFFKIRLDIVPKEENKGFLTFDIPREKEGLLSAFFAELEEKEEEFGIVDIQLGLTTLEEVFLNIAKQAELESASAKGVMVTLNLTSGKTIQIPKGARFVGIPGSETEENPTGFMVEVFWEQDVSGDLCISGHSSETPVPPNVQRTVCHSSSQRSFFGGDAIPVGDVINLNQIQAASSN